MPSLNKIRAGDTTGCILTDYKLKTKTPRAGLSPSTPPSVTRSNGNGSSTPRPGRVCYEPPSKAHSPTAGRLCHSVREAKGLAHARQGMRNTGDMIDCCVRVLHPARAAEDMLRNVRLAANARRARKSLRPIAYLASHRHHSLRRREGAAGGTRKD